MNSPAVYSYLSKAQIQSIAVVSHAEDGTYTMQRAKDSDGKDLSYFLFYYLDEDGRIKAPVIDRTFTKGGKEIKIFKLDKICGTCIAKNKIKSTVTLLTTTGVVNVKFRKEYFSLFDKQISVRGDDGVKHVVEKSWFNRGNMIVVTGMRSGDDFISKKYASTGGHQLYRIEKINEDGTLELKDHRYQGGIEEDD